MQLTVDKLEQFAKSKDAQALALEYFQLKAYAEITREKVDAIYQPIFEEFDFFETVYDDDGNETGEFQRITDRNYLYACDDDDLCNAYFDKCHWALIEAGYQVKYGYCPALMAETAVRDKEQQIIEAMCKLMGVEPSYHTTWRNQIRDLFLSMMAAEIKKQSRHN